MPLTFEQAEQQLTPAQKDALARFVLYDTKIDRELTAPERTFCFGLSAFCEYEEKREVERYLL